MRAAIVPPELHGSNCANIILVSPGSTLLKETLLGYISLPGTQKMLLDRRVGSAQTVVNTGVLKSLPTPIYSENDQATLAEAVSSVRRSRETAGNVLSLSSELFNSLQSRAFRSEL